MAAVEHYLPILTNAVTADEREHPHRRIEVLVSLTKWGLTSLKHYLEDARDSQIHPGCPVR